MEIGRLIQAKILFGPFRTILSNSFDTAYCEKCKPDVVADLCEFEFQDSQSNRENLSQKSSSKMNFHLGSAHTHVHIHVHTRKKFYEIILILAMYNTL